MLIYQGQLFISKREPNGSWDFSDDYEEWPTYKIGKKYFKEQYLIDMSEICNPIIEYWTYFPTNGLPKQLNINVYDGDTVVSTENIQRDFCGGFVDGGDEKGSDWFIRAIKQLKFSYQQSDEKENAAMRAIKYMWENERIK
jgi:hypothetical protein